MDAKASVPLCTTTCSKTSICSVLFSYSTKPITTLCQVISLRANIWQSMFYNERTPLIVAETWYGICSQGRVVEDGCP
jgi:hypothetical protein